ncbi:hypothetical protein GCM10023322_60270 [Rugosimonospora acidiphila]|uniref:NTP pyrophosphohydrolase n=1 Tax=Rugosimonospora acidiphila TaxID=556531 RepID=A0ABP9SGK6_9ACTN
MVGSVPDGWWRDRPAAAARLRDALVPVASGGLARVKTPVEIVLVVEGVASRLPEVPGVQVVRADGSGDDAIVELVKDRGPERKCVVVTADRELRSRVGELGASVLGPRSLPYP